MQSHTRRPALTMLESMHRPDTLLPAASAVTSIGAHAALVLWAVIASTEARQFTPQEEARAAQFLLPLRQEAPRPLQERVEYIGLEGMTAAAQAPKPEFTDRHVKQRTEIQAPETHVAEGVPEQQRAFSELEVDSTALRHEDSEGPVYPPALLEKGVEGMALVRFVVLSDGQVDLGTFRVIESTDSAFTLAARDALPRMKFRPAWLAGRPVDQLVEQAFTFRIRKPAT